MGVQYVLLDLKSLCSSCEGAALEAIKEGVLETSLLGLSSIVLFLELGWRYVYV